MPERPGASFDELLTRHRRAAGLTQEELADAAEVSTRTVSDLERGLTVRPHKDTTRRLASALNLPGQLRREFEAAARGLVLAPDHSPTGDRLTPDSTRLHHDPQEWLTFIVAELDEHGVSAARSAAARWQRQTSPDPAWLTWIGRLITLTAEGRLQPASRRPGPTAGHDTFVDREQQTAVLSDFLTRVQRGRGGLALVLGPAGIGKSCLVLNVLHGLPGEIQVDWLTIDRGEAGYRGWRRLLAPLWITLRRTELAPATLSPHSAILDGILLTGGQSELAGRPFPGEVADAIAALLSHLAEHAALVLIIDDAHRGGATSDHLLLEVARRVNASRAGLIAALRPDELEQESPLRSYDEEADRRSAADVVVPVQLPPLDRTATASLLRERTGVEPPAGIVDQVHWQTGGFPQLIDSTDVQAPATGTPAASWAVGGLSVTGLLVLRSIIASRTEPQRTVLQAAAVCSIDGCIEPEFAADAAELPADLVEQVLGQERRQGTILTPLVSGYCFRHDNWIDALIDSCPPARLHALHARCLASLSARQTSDPRRLAHHGIKAGAPLVGATDLVNLAKDAADANLADYAFSSAAELYEMAADHASGDERIDLLIRQSDALRFQGRWDKARAALRRAVSLARTLDVPGREAVALIHLERLTFSYGLDEKDLTQQIRDVLKRLPRDEMVLRAQAQAALAMRLGITAGRYDNERADLARAALDQLPAVTDRLARADIIIGVRAALQDSEPPQRLLDFDRQALDLAIDLHSGYHLEEALGARIIDVLRSGKLIGLPAAIRAHRDFAQKSVAPLAAYSQAIIDAMLALARGDFDAAHAHTDEAGAFSAAWGGSMVGETLMAQTGWRLYETGQVTDLAEMLQVLPQQDVSSVTEPLWTLAAGIINAETGSPEPAIRTLRDVCAETRDLADLPRSAGRIGILAAAAIVLGHPAVGDILPPDEASRLASSIVSLLAAHPDQVVVAGWPAVLLGSKHRYIGLAHLAAGQMSKAAKHLTRASHENNEFPVLDTRTRYDLARALIRQPAANSEGTAEMKRVHEQAARLGMAGLAAQAATELQRNQHPER